MINEQFPLWRKWIMRVCVAMILIGSLVGGCSYINKKLGLKNDNAIESNLEKLIEAHTGLSIDLTPEDPDDDDYNFDIWIKD